jgi:hypothetical protein
MLRRKVHFSQAVLTEKRSSRSAEVDDHISLKTEALVLNVSSDFDLLGSFSKILSVDARGLVVEMLIHAAIPQVAKHPGIRPGMRSVPITGHCEKVGQVVNHYGGYWSLDNWNIRHAAQSTANGPCLSLEHFL